MTAPLTLLLMPWGRVGSNMVNAALASIREVKVYNETLTGIESRHPAFGQPGRRAEIGAAQIAWLDETLAPGALNGPTVLNHAALSTADPQGMADWIDRRGVRLITLDRADDAAVALSSARAKAWVDEGIEKGEKRNWSISSKVEFRPYIAPEQLSRNLHHVRAGRAIMQQLVGTRPALALFYEDLTRDLDGSMAALMRHAGITWRPFPIRTSRFGSAHLSQMVANPEELADLLAQDGGATALTL